MAVPFDKPVVCPVLIGLARVLEQVRGGSGQGGLVAGEAGIGKSRLVAEATARADRQGSLVLQGTCFEPDRALPYAPLLDLLRAYLAPQPRAALGETLGDEARELVKILPELAGWLP